VVSGPYRIVSYRQNEAIVLERNPRFGGEPAGIPRIVFRVIPDAATLLAELEAGGIDVLENVPAEHVERLGARPELVMHTVHDLSYTFICWNLRSPLFEDSRVRRALTLAIDRQAIIDGLLFGRGRTVATPIMSLYWAHDPSVQPLPYSPQRARELLGAAGWRDADGDGVLDKDGRRFEFILESNQGSKQRNDAAVMVQADLEKVGIAAQPRVIEWRRFLQKHEERDFDAFLGKYREATKVDLKSLLHSTAVEKGYNYGGYASEAMDRVIDEARVETDTSKAKALWARTQAIFHQEQPLTILFETERVNAVNRRISGVSMSPRSVFSSLTEWRLNEEVAASSPVGD